MNPETRRALDMLTHEYYKSLEKHRRINYNNAIVCDVIKHLEKELFIAKADLIKELNAKPQQRTRRPILSHRTLALSKIMFV